tara:strand:+ start:724 stop:1062 length:339 start_codon:yes stop_codon:yes gene_type:complete
MANYSRARNNYVKSDVLGTMGESFHFDVTPAKQCGGGWYMFTGDPEMSAFCGSMTECQSATYSCGPGYNGWPKTFKYTPESDAKYANERCSTCNGPEQVPCATVAAAAPGIL